MKGKFTSPALSHSKTEPTSEGVHETTSRLCLEIRRGLTKFPRRPIVNDRFLIGAGAGCDLRLCGWKIPPLHSLIHVDGNDVWLEAVVSNPPLLVNGKIEKTVSLEEGDLIEIGSFQLIVGHATPADIDVLGRAENVTKIVSDDPQYDANSDQRPVSEERTASELVELIEADEKLVEDFEVRRNLGATALLHAAMESAQSDSDEISLLAEKFDDEDGSCSDEFPTIIPFNESVTMGRSGIVEQMEHIVEHLELFDAEIETRTKQCENTVLDNSEAAAGWRAVERRLFQQLRTVLNRLNSSDDDQDRAIA